MFFINKIKLKKLDRKLNNKREEKTKWILKKSNLEVYR